MGVMGGRLAVRALGSKLLVLHHGVVCCGVVDPGLVAKAAESGMTPVMPL